MSRLVMTSLLVCGVVVAMAAQGGVPPPPPQEGSPGRGTQARMYVLNRDKSEAIPVTVVSTEPVRATIAGTATVRVDPESAVNVRAVSVRQVWEYRTLPIGANDPTSMLNGAGAITTVVIQASEYPAWRDLALITGICVVMAIVMWIAFRSAGPIARRLGPIGLNIVTRVMGILVTATAFGLLGRGIAGLLPGLAR